MEILKKIADRSRKIITGYVYYSFPLTLMGFFIFNKYKIDEPSKFLQPSYGVFLNTLIQIAGVQVFTWILISLLFSVTLFFSSNNREIFLKKLSGIKERDEREVQIVSKALRASYLSTMTILVFMFFIYLISVKVEVNDKVGAGEHHGSITYSAGIEYRLVYPGAITTQKEGYDFFFKNRWTPLTLPVLILILLIWQIVSLKIVARKLSKLPG